MPPLIQRFLSLSHISCCYCPEYTLAFIYPNDKNVSAAVRSPIYEIPHISSPPHIGSIHTSFFNLFGYYVLHHYMFYVSFIPFKYIK